MRVLFCDLSCGTVSNTCAFVSFLSYDSDEGCLWFESDDTIYSLSIPESLANHFMRCACRDGFVDLTASGSFSFRELD